jgi:hypothetical protein
MRQIYRGIRPMNQSGKYRQAASQCYEGARIISDPREKAKWLAMAQSWILLADQAERNSNLDPIYAERAQRPSGRRSAG